MHKPTPHKENPYCIINLAITPTGYEVLSIDTPPVRNGPGRRPGPRRKQTLLPTPDLIMICVNILYFTTHANTLLTFLWLIVRISQNEMAEMDRKYGQDLKAQQSLRRAQEAMLYQRPPHITLPISTAWFDINSISDVERQALPEFFNKKPRDTHSVFEKGERLYMYYRNSMIAMWRTSPKLYISTAACCRVLMGDTCSILRVHAFLEHWGLINAQSRETKGAVVVAKQKTIECYICSNKQYLVFVYNKLHSPFVVCYGCFGAKRYPEFMATEDFQQVDLSANRKVTEIWTPEEELLLVEQVQATNPKNLGDWAEIVKHFPSIHTLHIYNLNMVRIDKSPQKVVTHFLKLPTSGTSSTTIFQNGEDTLQDRRKLTRAHNIFEDIHNPIQAGVAILNYHYKNDEEKDPETVRIMEAAKERVKYLAEKKHAKMDKMGRQLLDFFIHKLQSKVAYLHEFGGQVEQEMQANSKVRCNQIAQLLKESMNLRVFGGQT